MTTGAPAAEAEGRGPDDAGGLTGRGGWHLVAFLAALALVLAMSLDWYTTEQGEEYRRIEEINSQREDPRRLDSQDVERAAQAAEAEEKNAFQANAFVDRLILLACLAALAAAVATALLRSMGRRAEPPWNPSALATVAGILATLMILYRMIQPPGFNEAAVVKPGVPIALAAVGILTVAARLATLIEREERLGPEVVAAAEAEAAAKRRGRGRRAGAGADSGEGADPRGRRGRRSAAGTEAGEGAPGAEPEAGSALGSSGSAGAPGFAPPPAAPSGPPAPAPEPPRTPGSLWAPPPRDPAAPGADTFGPVEDPSAEAREVRRRAREQARAARSGEQARAARSGLGGAADSERREDHAVELSFDAGPPDPAGREDAPPEPPPADRPSGR